jgi:hypothetical protein
MFAANRNPLEVDVGTTQMDTKVVCGVTLRKDPARESCFKVVDTDAEMVAWADMSPQSRRERLHRHMNNEMTSLDIAAQCLADFPDAPWDLRMQIARQVWDESRHVTALHLRLRAIGGFKGEFPVANFEWTVTCLLDSLIGRMLRTNVATEPDAVGVRTDLDNLITKLSSCGGSCAADRTEVVVKASCAALLGSAVTLLH